jgi:predicted dehydrogenase
MSGARIRTGVIGCGLIGKRRAAVAAAHSASTLEVVADAVPAVADAVAAEFGCRRAARWEDVVHDQDVDAVVIATPNAFLAEIAVVALDAGKHVLLEKPMGRNLAEAQAIAAAAERANRRVKVGFNHRYHPAISRAHDLFAGGLIGRLINLRIRYGHGGRPGYEKEWRGNPELAGGGELTDQGVHALDLIHWFAGRPTSVAALTQTAVWPIAPLEDNGVALLAFENGAIASFHTSWTQWKNLFSLEVFGERGALVVDGLGGSYGVETLTVYERAMTGGAPTTRGETFDGPDPSWQLEWDAFVAAVSTGAAYDGNPADGLAVMSALDALYRSASSRTFVRL